MVVATGTSSPFRAYPWEGADEDGTVHWQMEYQQDKSGYWGPRGSFEEKAGVFHWDGREFATVEEVLVYRDRYPGGRY